MQPALTSKISALLKPTVGQTLGFIGLALAIILAANVREIYTLAGIDPTALNAALDQFHQRTSGILTTQTASTAALVTFWAIIGMIAYLICWSAYNFMIEARNEVTLNTQYTNRGHRTGRLGAIIIKIVAAVLLLVVLSTLKSGFPFWLAQAAPAFIELSMATVAIALAATLGLAAHLYLVLAMAMAVFTPWYRK